MSQKGYLLLRVTISPSDISLAALQGVDIHRVVKLLAAVDPFPFSAVEIQTVYGLVVCTFHGERDVVCAMGFDLLLVTKEMKVSDDGLWVDRYAKIVEELLKRASDKLKLPMELRELKRRDVLTLN
jgi:hypothetical protein